MAQTARKVDTSEERVTHGTVVPIGPQDLLAKTEAGGATKLKAEMPASAKWHVPRVLRSTTQALGTTFRDGIRQAANVSTRLAQRPRKIVRDVSTRTQKLKNEQPERLLAVVAGTAFLAGVLLRIWRSRYE